MLNWINYVLDRIDRGLVKLTEQAVKKWNYLTGRDQFFLSRAVLGSAATYLILTILLGPRDYFIVRLMLMSWFCVFSGRIIKNIETTRLGEQSNNIKRIGLSERLKVTRKLSMVWSWGYIMLLLASALVNIGSKNQRDYYTILSFLKLSACISLSVMAIFYLLSIGSPPFKKSQVLDWFRSLTVIMKPIEAVERV